MTNSNEELKKERERMRKVTEVLKKRFNNLSATELMNLAFDILEALDNINES